MVEQWSGDGWEPSDGVVPGLVVTRVDRLDCICLVAAGEIDCASAPQFLAPLQRAIVDTDGLILINLGAVTFMDSSGVNALAAARESAGPRLRIGMLHPATRRVLEMTAVVDTSVASDDVSSR